MHRITHLVRTSVVAAAVAVFAMAALPDEPPASPIAESEPLSVPAPAENGREATPVVSAVDTHEPLEATVADPDLTAESAALYQQIQVLVDRLAAAAPGTTEVDEVDNEIVKVLEDQQTALAGALDSLEAAEGDAETEARWQAVELHGEALKRLVRLRAMRGKPFGGAPSGAAQL